MLFNKLFSRKTTLDKRIEQNSQALLIKARDQSWQFKINITEEAKKIATSCGMRYKKRIAADFVDIALWLLCYPAELAYTIAIELTNFRPYLEWNPFGTIMDALGQIDSLYRGMYIDTSMLDEKPEFFEVVNSKSVRIKKAAQLLAVAILTSSQNVAESRKLYDSIIYDSSLKAALDEELKRRDEEIAQKLLNEGS
jgi:hypothetical protein